MQNGKSPGNDGLSKEFYVCAELRDLLVKTLNYSFKGGVLTTSRKQTIITSVEKKRQGQKADEKLETNFTSQC